MIYNDSIHLNHKKIQTIQGWKKSTMIKAVEKFIGLVKYVAQHLPHIATPAAQITSCTGNTDFK